MSEATIHVLDVNHCVATWERTLIKIWRRETTPESLKRMSKIAFDLVERGNGPVTCISIVEETSRPPNEASRAELAKFSKEVVARMGAAVIVAEGNSFRSSLVRSVGTTLTVLSPHRVPWRFFGNTTDGIAHLAAYLPQGAGGAAGLRRALEDLRERHFPREDGTGASADKLA